MDCKVCNKEIKQYQNRCRKRCGSCNTKIRRYRTKQAAIELLGGKCSCCGWSGHQAGFDFHHPDQNKEFAVGDVANKAWEFVLKEVSKCELLCSNCHRIEHSERVDQIFLDEVAEYKGRILAV